MRDPGESLGKTNAVDLAKLFPPDRSGSANGAVHPGGLAKGDLPKLFWRTHERSPRFLGVSDDSQLLYAADVVTGISALRTADATPVWTLPSGINGVVGPNEFYALSDRNGTTILQRTNSAGEIAWRFTATGAKSVVRAPNGTLYVSGGYLWAINENGGLVWRMELQDSYPGMPELSADGKTLYLVSTTHVFAVDTEKVRLRWRVDNPCRSLFPECRPRPLADGKVAIESVEPDKTEPQTLRTGLQYQLRVLDAQGKTLWARDDRSTTEYVVPPATSLLVLRTNFGLEFVDASGKAGRKEPGRWGSLGVTRQPGVFFACSLDGLTGFASDGRQELNIGNDKLEGTMCSGVSDGRGDLLFLESRDIYDRYSLWSVRFP